jgi:hypothetical protein
MPSLSLKASINYPFIGGGSVGPSYDPDAQAWFSAVEATGSTITATNKTAFNTAFLSLKSNNIWDKIAQGCFFVGIDGANPLTGAFTPFKTPAGITPTNTNFTTSDYNRLTGILSDGDVDIASTKRINTNINNVFPYSEENPLFPIYDRHLLLYNTRNDLINSQQVGSMYQSLENYFNYRINSTQTGNWTMTNNSASQFISNLLYIPNGGRGFAGIQYADLGNASIAYFLESNYLKFLQAGVPTRYNPTTASGAPFTDVEEPIFINSLGAGGAKRIAYYSLGLALPDSVGDSGLTTVQTYDTIMNTLLSSLV